MRYAQDLNRPLPVVVRHPLDISLAKGDAVFGFTLGPPVLLCSVRCWWEARFLLGMVA